MTANSNLRLNVAARLIVVHLFPVAALVRIMLLCATTAAEPPIAATQTTATSVAATQISSALTSALRGTAGVAVVVDAGSGDLLAAGARPQTADVEALPGSLLKPLFLSEALKQNLIRPDTAVFCRRSLHIGGRDLHCTHPQTDVAFDAEQALAYSCNNYFAELGKRLSSTTLREAVNYYGLGRPTHLLPGESAGVVVTPHSDEQRELFALGLDGIRVTPVQIAVAYRRLWLEMQGQDLNQVLRPVKAGLRDSVEYGMAHNAWLPGVEIWGKTGTASDPGQFRNHGWFAGVAKIEEREVVMVMYLPDGNGADAAALARRFVLSCERGHTR